MNYKESEKVELKRQVTSEIKKEIIAFANTSGGTILVGVEDDGNVVGLSNIDDETQKITNMVRDTIRPDLTMFLKYSTVSALETDKEILEVDINEGTHKPYYVSSKGLRPEGVYVRQGTSSAPASIETIRKMIAETDGRSFESMRSMEQNLTFHSLENSLLESNIPLSEQSFQNLGLIQKRTGEYTNLALLLSDQNPYCIKAAVFENKETQTFQERKIFSGSLIRQIEEAYQYLISLNGSLTKIAGLKRMDLKKWSPEAIRETILNAVIHREYGRNGDNLIQIDQQEITVISIGGLPSGINESELGTGLSIPRNPHLSNLFYRLGYVEAFGTGLKRIAGTYLNQSKKPIIKPTQNAFFLTLPARELEPDTNSKNIYDTDQVKLIQFIKEKGSVTRADVEESFSLSKRAALQLLKNSLDAGAVKVNKRGRKTSYELPR